jgi:diadenosine tetraphosphate (Ap4A) HIT family hydrolase
MQLPFAEPLTPIAPGSRVLPEPLRKGEPGGDPCTICRQDEGIWSDARWVLHNSTGGSLPGTLWLASRLHVDSFKDLPPELAADYAHVVARIERAILSLGDIARVHVYRWGDGVAHFHVWFMPRPLGMLEATRYTLPVWEDRLPPAPASEVEKAGRAIAVALEDEMSNSANGDEGPTSGSLGSRM